MPQLAPMLWLSITIALAVISPRAGAQLFQPTSHTGIGLAEVSFVSASTDQPVGLTDWDWLGVATLDGPGLPVPCPSASARALVHSWPRASSLSIELSGEIDHGADTEDCGVDAVSLLQDEWTFLITQATCFRMTVVMNNAVSQGDVQLDAAFLLRGALGGLQLTVGSLDSPTAISRVIPSGATTAFTYAGTIQPGAYTIRFSGRAAAQSGVSHGAYDQRLSLVLGRCCGTADFNNDDDVGTDADIEAFFACLGGSCCPTCPPSADFNADGDVGTDSDIEAFFRVLAGANC